MGAPPVIEVDELRVRRPGAARDAVDGISFEVAYRAGSATAAAVVGLAVS